jgi:hypothetical protein
VDIYDGDTKLTTVQAGEFRQDLATMGNGKHAFQFPTPDALKKDGKPHKIGARFAGTNKQLSGSPKDLKLQ